VNALRKYLGDAIASQCAASEVGLLLSGGLDSLTVGIACEDVGKRVIAYTYELDGFPSVDRPKAEHLAILQGWPLYVVQVPTTRLSESFRSLAIQHHCRKKVHFEVTYPMSFVIPLIEQTEMLSGWNADDHYGNTAKVLIEFAKTRREGASEATLKAYFDKLR
jgi:asparagine synthetase B (glutamine-hydrolysing)